MSDNICELNIPYPPTDTCEKNPCYASLLSEDYAGYNSEMTAINQYFFQYLCIQNEHCELAHVLECISLVEMRHMNLLGQLIVNLGCIPVIGSFSRRRTRYWCGNNINENLDVQCFLRQNIENEKKQSRHTIFA